MGFLDLLNAANVATLARCGLPALCGSHSYEYHGHGHVERPTVR